MVQALLSTASTVPALSICSDHSTALAMAGADRKAWWMFCASKGKFYHVALWLLCRVRHLVMEYECSCQSIAWIDIDDNDGHDEEALNDLGLHRGLCRSLYSTYACAVQTAAITEPDLQGWLGELVFALEMVTESEMEGVRDADLFFLDLLSERVCESLESVLVRFV